MAVFHLKCLNLRSVIKWVRWWFFHPWLLQVKEWWKTSRWRATLLIFIIYIVPTSKRCAGGMMQVRQPRNSRAEDGEEILFNPAFKAELIKFALSETKWEPKQNLSKFEVIHNLRWSYPSNVCPPKNMHILGGNELKKEYICENNTQKLIILWEIACKKCMWVKTCTWNCWRIFMRFSWGF